MRTVLFLALLCVAARAIQPVLFFPGYSLSKLAVTVTGGTLAGCPSSGSFVVHYQMNNTQNGFSEECMMNYLNLTYNAATDRFSNRPDVTISIPGLQTGNTECFGGNTYDGTVAYFTSKGYTINSPNATFLAACFDWRMDPAHDTITTTFMANTYSLVEKAYAAAGNQKVWLIGHSNGPIMMLYFLNQATTAYKQKYIAGFIPISGNFAGQGLFPAVFVAGLSVVDFSFSLATANVHRYWPADYFSCPQPIYFTGANSLTFLQNVQTSVNYNVTSADMTKYYTDINNNFGLRYWDKYAGLVGPHTPPGVYTYAIWGANIPTVVGLRITSFANVTIENYLYRNGDINQEDIDNESCKLWATNMPKGCFDFQEVDGVDHFALNSDINVLNKIYSLVSGTVPAVTCSATTSTSSAARLVISLFLMVVPLFSML